MKYCRESKQDGNKKKNERNENALASVLQTRKLSSTTRAKFMIGMEFIGALLFFSFFLNLLSRPDYMCDAWKWYVKKCVVRVRVREVCSKVKATPVYEMDRMPIEMPCIHARFPKAMSP